MDAVEGAIYEVNDKGEQEMVRSLESTQRVFLRFTNRTSRPVDVAWRDFQGARRHYIRLDPGAYYDINSFLTHPWEFRDAATEEPFVVNNKHIFRAPAHVGGMLYRTNWNVSVEVRSLRRTALLALAERLERPDDATELHLPQVLASELQELVRTLQTTVPNVQIE